MQYLLIMTEGNVEQTFLEVCFNKNVFPYNKKDLLYEKIVRKRQLDSYLIQYILQLNCNDSVLIVRLGDKLTDELRIPKQIPRKRIAGVINICIQPEFEALFLLKEGLFAEFSKVKSKMKPSEFYERTNKNYHKQSEFVRDYFERMTKKDIIDLILSYDQKRSGVNKKNHFETLSWFLNDKRKLTNN